MAAKLKELFDERAVRSLAGALGRAHRGFGSASFVRACLDGLEALELTGRAWQIAEAMHAHLPAPFPNAARVITASLGPELESSEEFGLEPLLYMPHVFFVQKYGLRDFEVAMALQYELTKRFSAESSIRAYLSRYPKQTYARLRVWSTDPNVHVRRLVSEGTRPRLPWAPRLREFQKDPAPVLKLLERLKDDPERYVQRSVANNLNDIAKDHPDVAVSVCERWLRKPTPSRTFIARHALRSLVKQGHGGALGLMGAGERPRIRIENARVSPKRIRIGDTVSFSFCLVSTAPGPQQLIVDYAAHLVKASGARKPKVFKLRKLELQPRQSVALSGRLSFAPMTTRRHYPGRHALELLVNGTRYPLVDFELRS